MALAVVRALGEAGVPVFVLRQRPARHGARLALCRGAFTVPAPQEDEGAFVDAVVRHAAHFPGAMLVPASDEALAAVSRHRDRLARAYVVACPDWEVARRLVSKRETYALAAAAGVATPRTFAPATLADARAAAAQLGFPLLVKPSQSHLFAARFQRKMVEVHGDAESALHLEAAWQAGLDVLLQELVPGDDAEVVNYNAYVSGGRALVEFTARQLRKAPPRFGSPRVAVSERIEAVLEPGRRTLRALGFEGFACTEFKRDARDGLYKVLDVNGRPNLSGLLAVRCGINFPLLEYRHRMHGELPAARRFTEGVYWTDAFRDAGYALLCLGQERHAARDWLGPYLLPGTDATWDVRNPGPALVRARYSVGGARRRA